MLDNLTDGFTSIIKKMRGHSRITESNVVESIDLIKKTLIDADVALPIVEQFVDTVKEKALGHKVIGSLSPAQAFIGVVQSELIKLMGTEAAPIQVPTNDPLVILMAGLQGSGKTTTVAKLAKYLKKNKKRVLVASTDIYRPAAIEQLEILCKQVDVDFHEPEDDEAKKSAVERAKSAVASAPSTLHDYVILDTAGRNVIDKEMMDEIETVSKSTLPAETLLVIDSTQGQQALEVAKRFDEILAVTGVCLTKLDGDARGGAAMSARASLGVPIKFIGVGELPDDLQPFIPERMASRILGMGDIVSLVESATESMGKKRAAQLEKKLKRKKSPGLQLSDMIEQLRQAESMGGIDKIAGQLPTHLAHKVKASNIDPRLFKRMEAIYNSMTKFERLNPQYIKASRKKRIADGAGVEIQQVNQLLTQHAQANKLMRKAARNPVAGMNLMRNMLGR